MVGRSALLRSSFQYAWNIDDGQDAPPYKLRDYGFKRMGDDMVELARQLGSDRIILGGHDW